MPDVTLPDGRVWRVARLFQPGAVNAKLKKNEQCVMLGLSMTPHRVPGLGNVCPHASKGCAELCLNMSGRSLIVGAQQDTILSGRLARRILFARHREVFFEMWDRELRAAVHKGKRLGLPVVCRPNVLSDIDWAYRFPEVIEDHPDVRMYGYTKDPDAMSRFLNGAYAPHYFLCFSRSETNEHQAIRFLQRGGTCAVVFNLKYSSSGHKEPMPPTWHGFPVLDGDLSDRRDLDPPGHVIGLRAKGKARVGRGLASGFVVAVDAETYTSANI